MKETSGVCYALLGSPTLAMKAQSVLARLDGSREVMNEQIQYLNEYGSVRIGRR